MDKQKINEIHDLAQPLIAYLKANCHPYAVVVVTDERVAVVETVASIPM